MGLLRFRDAGEQQGTQGGWTGIGRTQNFVFFWPRELRPLGKNHLTASNWAGQEKAFPSPFFAAVGPETLPVLAGEEGWSPLSAAENELRDVFLSFPFPLFALNYFGCCSAHSTRAAGFPNSWLPFCWSPGRAASGSEERSVQRGCHQPRGCVPQALPSQPQCYIINRFILWNWLQLLFSMWHPKGTFWLLSIQSSLLLDNN